MVSHESKYFLLQKLRFGFCFLHKIVILSSKKKDISIGKDNQKLALHTTNSRIDQTDNLIVPNFVLISLIPRVVFCNMNENINPYWQTRVWKNYIASTSLYCWE